MESMIGSGADAATNLIKDATIETFADDVMAASREVPVIVDFWAEWCGPCKTLGPMLEKAVAAQGGKVRMVKIDIDKNKMLAQQLQIQSVPTVMAFMAGQPVDGFAGALPESQINAFLDRVVQMASQAGLTGGQQGPSEEEILAAAAEALDAGDVNTSAQLYSALAQQIIEETSEKARALAGLAKCHLTSGNTEEAQAMFDLIPESFAGESDVTAVKAMLELAQLGDSAGDLGALQTAASSAPNDMDAQYAYAEALIGASQLEPATEILLQMIAKDRDWNEEAARKKLVTVFDALGFKDPIAKNARRKLSSILFS